MGLTDIKFVRYGVVTITVIIVAWFVLEFFGLIDLIVVQFPYPLPFWITLIGTLGTVVLTGALVWLYYQQKSILDKQVRISEFGQLPHLVGPYAITYDDDELEFSLELSNPGGGVAKNIVMVLATTFIDSEGNEFDGQDDKPVVGAEHISPLEREGEGITDPSVLNPGEMRIRFTGHMRVIAHDLENSESIDIYQLDQSGKLDDVDLKEIVVRLLVRYHDQHGRNQDPYGEKFELVGPAVVAQELGRTYGNLSYLGSPLPTTYALSYQLDKKNYG